jgi:GGDEF domain-containing protein
MAARNGAVVGFGDRAALVRPLERALEPDRALSVLAVLDLSGAEEHRRRAGEVENERLLEALAATLQVSLPRGVGCYRSRRDEFCLLLEDALGPAEATLATAVAAPPADGAAASIVAAYGVAVLPDEADEPLEALMVADRQLELARRARERRHAASR